MELSKIAINILPAALILLTSFLWKWKCSKIRSNYIRKEVEHIEHIDNLIKKNKSLKEEIKDLTGQNGYEAFEKRASKYINPDMQTEKQEEFERGIMSKSYPSNSIPGLQKCNHDYIPLTYHNGISILQCKYCGEIPLKE